MKYIKKIILINFQSHKYTEIELNDKLNIIVGPSDSGKTAIMRAVKWALYNEPSGDYFIREGESEVSVTLIFSDNTKLIRYRSKSKNVYELIYSNGEKLRLEGFGTGVPEEIREAIGIYKINLDGKETNSISLGEQLEGPFLLSEKTSTRASAIGQLVGVNVIDEALREVLKDVRTLHIKKKGLEEDIDSLNAEIKTFDYLEKLKITLNNVSNIRKKLLESKKRLDILNYNYEVLKELSFEINKFEKTKERLNRLDQIDEILIILEDKHTKYWHLNNYNEKLNRVTKGIIDNESVLNKIENIDISIDIQNRLMELVKNHTRLLNINSQYNKLKSESIVLNNNIKNLSAYLNNEDKYNKLQKLNDELHRLNGYKEKYLSVKTSISKGNNYIGQFESIDIVLEKIKILEKNTELLYKLNKLSEERSIIDKEISGEVKIINKARADIRELVYKYKSILNNIEKCPLCLSEIDNDKISHILEHYIGG